MESLVYSVAVNSCSASETLVDLVPMLVWRIHDQDRVFILTSPILLGYSKRQDGTLNCSERNLGIESYGRSRDEASIRFGIKFSILWDEIATEDDALLTPRAIALKQRMKAVVAAVEVDDFGTASSPETTQTTHTQGIRAEDWEATSYNFPTAYQWA